MQAQCLLTQKLTKCSCSIVSLHAVFMHETLQCTLDLMYEDLPTMVHRGCACVFDAATMEVALWPVFTGSSCGHWGCISDGGEVQKLRHIGRQLHCVCEAHAYGYGAACSSAFHTCLATAHEIAGPISVRGVVYILLNENAETPV